jgi:hypothetical protein
MPLPRSVVRINRNGVKFTSSVERAEYTLEELTRAALRDIGKLVTFKARDKVRAIANHSMKRSQRVKNAFQSWNRRRETDLQVGIKHETWYGVDQELGLDGQPKRDILRKTVFENVNVIQEISAKYLKHIEDEMTAQRMIDENAEVADDD